VFDMAHCVGAVSGRDRAAGLQSLLCLYLSRTEEGAIECSSVSRVAEALLDDCNFLLHTKKLLSFA
jgi:hypothetical protein